MKLYCDNAAMHPLHPEVKRVIRDFLDADIRNPSAIYADGRKTKTLLEAARARVAKAIGADPDEIFFTSGSTEAINWMMGREDKEYLLTTPIEHKAVLNNATKNDYIPVDENGRVILDRFRNIVTSVKGAFTVVVGLVNNEIGTIQPIKEIAEICSEARACLCVDATQAIGHIPINVHEIGCDYLCGSFGKLGGLTGSGFLYAKKSATLSPMLRGGGQERGLRAGTENLIGIVAGAKAIELATQDLDIKMSHMTMIRDNIISGLLQIPKSHLNGSLGNRVCNNVNISFEGIEGESLVLNLDLHGIQASSGSACNSADIQPSHVLKAIGLSDDLARGALRLTVSEGMNTEEVEYVVETVTDCVARLRELSPKWKEIISEDT